MESVDEKVEKLVYPLQIDDDEDRGKLKEFES